MYPHIHTQSQISISNSSSTHNTTSSISDSRAFHPHTHLDAVRAFRPFRFFSFSFIHRTVLIPMIQVPPTNQTKLEGEKATFTCEAKAMPGNVTVRWFREGAPVREVASLETRVTIRKDGSLIINPVSADDSGQYLCEVTNGIGEPQSAAAHLNVECKLINYNIFCNILVRFKKIRLITHIG